MTRVDPVWAFPGLFVVLWSTGFIGAKLGLPYAEPATFLSLRFLLVVLILLPLCWLSRATWPDSRRAGHMVVAGLLLQGGYLGGVFAAIHHGMPAGMSALITGLQPLFTALLGGWLLGEVTTSRQWLGLTLGLAGVLLVVGERVSVTGLTAAAILFALLALASISLGTVWQKRHGGGVDLRTGAAIQFMAAALLIAPFSLLLETGQVAWTGQFVFALAWVVFGLSIGAIFLLLYLLRRGAATQVASMFYLVPPVTALMAWPLFGETYSLVSAAGMGLAVLAVWLVTTKAV
jgi:drug/metabolite transporter (DMT)-like permease